MIARGTEAQVSVLALVGERGREVREFLERDLGPEGLARSVVVVATSDQPALVRLRAAFTATRIAEWFRDQGNDVVLMMDSLTRFAMAQREVGLSAGEPPATRGYPPSVFSLLPRLLERAGAAERGSHHRAVHGAGRRRRHGRADRRLRPVDPRRPRRAVTAPGLGRPLPDASRCSTRSPGCRAPSPPRSRRPPPWGCAAFWPPSGRSRTWSRSAPTCPARTPTPTGAGPVGRHPRFPLPGHGRRRPRRRELGPPGWAARHEHLGRQRG